MIYQFEGFELDHGGRELLLSGSPVAVEPQVLDLLVLLIEHRDRMVSKQEIIETIWAGRVVSDAALSSRIKSARQALGDDGRQQRFIRTIHGRGFRFVMAVTQPSLSSAQAEVSERTTAKSATDPRDSSK